MLPVIWIAFRRLRWRTWKCTVYLRSWAILINVFLQSNHPIRVLQRWMPWLRNWTKHVINWRLRRVCSGLRAADSPVRPTESVPGTVTTNDTATGDDSWADIVGHHENPPNDQWTTVTRRRSLTNKPVLSVRVCGKKESEGVKAVPRWSVLAAFVGRLHQDTTEEDLTKYLLQEGMKGVVCRRLKPKEGHKFNTAAFFVSCCIESSDLFYDESCWPIGAELRDWVYKH